MRNAARLSAVTVLLFGLAVLSASPAAAAPATTSVPLPIDRAVAVAADEARDHLFVSTGPDRNEVLVTDLAGTEVRRLAGLPGASGLLLDGDTLYVAVHDAGSIAAFDAATLTETQRWSLPVDFCPDDLALTANRLVFTAHHCDPSMNTSWLGTLDRASGAVTHTFRAAGDLVIAANPASDGLVAVADTYLSGTDLLVYDVRGAEPTALRAAPNFYSSVADLTISPDGRSIFVSSGMGGLRMPLDTLTYGRSLTSSGVASWSGDGQNLVVGDGGSVKVWPEGATATSSGVAAPYGTSVKHGRLAVDRTASQAWAVSTDYYGGSPVLVRYDIAPKGTAWTLSASRILLPAQTPGTLRADLRVDGQPIADGTRLVVVVEYPDYTLTEEHYTSGGGISLSLYPPQGVTRYRFFYSDNVAQFAEAYADVVGTYDTRLLLHWGPEPPLYPDSYLGWYATLTDADGRALAGRRVTLTRTSGTSSEQIAELDTDRYGIAYFQIPGNGSAGTFTFTLRYAGDEAAAPAEQSTVLTIEKRDPYVSIEASLGTGKPGRTATVVGHLGNFHTNRTLTITATPDGGRSQVIAQGEVDENLTLTVQYQMKRATTFTVSYAGDEWYNGAEAATRLTLR